MKSQPIVLALAVSFSLFVTTTHAQWMDFSGGPNNATGTWTGATSLSGTASVTASNFINGNNSTVQIGVLPISLTSLSTDFYNAGLIPNTGNIVPSIGAPFNDTGDKYQVVIDFSSTTGPNSSGVLPTGTTVAIIDMDINETFSQVFATDAANNVITSAWLSPLQAYFDMTSPLFNGGNVAPWQPTVSEALGVYDMVGNPGNFDSGMMLFQTTQDVRTISLYAEVGGPQGVIGGGGATIGFYAPVPEPSTAMLAFAGLGVMFALRTRTTVGRGV